VSQNFFFSFFLRTPVELPCFSYENADASERRSINRLTADVTGPFCLANPRPRLFHDEAGDYAGPLSREFIFSCSNYSIHERCDGEG
jgi:hypothetical protein